MKKLLMTVVIALAVLALAPAAKADTACAANTICTFLLSQTNTTVLNGTQILVTIDNKTGANTTVTFTLTAVPAALVGVGVAIDQVGWNGIAISGGPAGWVNQDLNPPPCSSMNGFGSFCIQSANSGAPFSTTSVTFTLSNLTSAGINFAANSKANEFAAHVRFQTSESCSTFVGGQSDSPNGGTGGAGCPSSVPEPGTMTLLLASGLLGLGLAALRRRLL